MPKSACRIPGLDTTDMATITTKFWEEYKDFQNMSGVYKKKIWWNSPNALLGKSHL